MVEFNIKKTIFRKRLSYFDDYPHDVSDCDAVFFYACKNKAVGLKGFNCKKSATLVIDLTQDTDIIWKNIHKKSCRAYINRAIREGIRFDIDQDHDKFYKLCRRFMRDKDVAFKEIGAFLKYGTLFTANLDGEVLAGQITVEDRDHIRGIIGASKRLEVNDSMMVLISSANRLVEGETIKYAKQKGIKEYDFGGYYTGVDKTNPMYGINLYKEKFGGKLKTYYTCSKYYSRVYSLAKKFI